MSMQQRAIRRTPAGIASSLSLTLLAAGTAALPAMSHAASPIMWGYLTGNRLVSFDQVRPATLLTDVSITGITAGESIAGIDFRPQNGFLYGLGINSTANTGTLYCISRRTGVATAVGAAGSIAFVDAVNAPLDLPDPDAAGVGYGFDFNPAVDRLRVTTSTGLNFRLNPNTGAAVDGDLGGAPGTVVGVNPDGSINGSGSTGISGVAYTNNRQVVGGATTTLYALDNTQNMLFIQNLPNAGTQTLGQTITLQNNPLDFTAVNGFEISQDVSSGANNSAVTSGVAHAALPVAGVTGLYEINLVNARATLLGTIDTGTTAVRGLTIQNDRRGFPIVALSANGTNLTRFNTLVPGNAAIQAITGVVAGDQLVAIDYRPQTGQLYGLGVNAVANDARLYLIDPQTGVATSIGGPIAFVLPSPTPLDLPDPATTGYGIDFNPAVDRIRVTTASGLNFRINPNNGFAVDGDPMQPGVNPDGNINGSGSVGVSATAYTNSFGQSLTGGVTTLYTLDADQNGMMIQNPPNAGVQTGFVSVTIDDLPIDFTGVNGFDIPAEVSVTSSSSVATGSGLAVLTVGGVASIFRIDLTSGVATSLGPAPTALLGLTLGDIAPIPPDELFGNGFE